MSARPDIRPLPDEELDLLISRSLDGDLSSSEEQDLKTYLAAVPVARQRYAALESLVQDLRKLPEPVPPFALAARVNSQVDEHSSGLAAAFQRFGLFLPPGAVTAAAGLVAVGVVVGVFMGGGTPRTAQSGKALEIAGDESNGPVRVFFDRSRQAPAPNVASRAAGAANAPAGPASPPARAEAKAPAEVEVQALQAAPEKAGVETKDSLAEVPAGAIALGRADQAESKLKAEASPAGRVSAQAVASSPSPARRASEWTVSVVQTVGDSVAWRLRKSPAAAVPDGPETYRLLVRLDSSGRIVAMTPTKGSPVPSAEAEKFIRGLDFEKIGGGTGEGEVEIVVEPR